MKNKLALKLSSIHELTKNEQKKVNGGGSNPCCPGQPTTPPPGSYSCTSNPCRGNNGSSNHPCISNPYSSNCANYCMSGGYCPP